MYNPDLDEIEMQTQDQIIARRNLRLGIWAGMRLGFRGERLSQYAQDVMAADYRLPGPDDVIEKITDDFEDRGVDYPIDLIRLEMQRLERQVRAELSATD
ncbi:MAG: DUF1476 family protein [Alphaproteobacteria bacterium]|nr:DUF1476 family protein [Alphaproteobacteria bacterium]